MARSGLGAGAIQALRRLYVPDDDLLSESLDQMEAMPAVATCRNGALVIGSSRELIDAQRRIDANWMNAR